jgi:DNA-directed RNA polymerase specialized sigma24 family protein
MNGHQTTDERALPNVEKSALTDDQGLVLQAKSGRSDAFGELYERHRLKTYRSVLRILRNAQDAEDGLQQSSFQRAFTNLHRFREDSAFSTYTRIANDVHRRHRVDHFEPTDYAQHAEK